MSDAGKPPLPPERYDDRGPFAQGGTAAVHLAVDRLLGRSVAGKILKSGDTKLVERFRREACITAQLEHPNIVPVHDLGPTWFTMKRIEGATLSAIVRSEPYGPALLSRALEILLKVCDALGYAHDRTVIHRDIKPENVMVGRFGQVYLMDFGIAQVSGQSDSPYAGTTAWVAPEQARGEVCDVRTDVWGVGGLLYFVLCGGRPNQGKEPEERLANARAGVRPRPPGEVAPSRSLPSELVRIAMKALDPEPARRYPSVAALAADLEAVRAGGWWFELRSFPEGAEIVREGDEADAAYILVEGAVEVCQNGGPIAELGPGEVFGEAALLAGGPRTATVVALTPVVTRVLTREALEAELGRDGWMGALVRGLARRFHELSLENRDRRS
jgi:serine/threonine-protein kinase